MLDLFLFRNEKNVLVKFNFHWDYLGKLIWNQPLGTLKQQSNDSLIYLPDLANVKLWLWQIAFNTTDTICYSFLAESYTIVLPPNVIWTQGYWRIVIIITIASNALTTRSHFYLVLPKQTFATFIDCGLVETLYRYRDMCHVQSGHPANRSCEDG